MSLLERLDQAQNSLDQHHADPWHNKLQQALRGVETIGTAALLDVLRVPATTGNARRLAAVMRELGYVPLKSRRLLPGGWRTTSMRGWTRPVRLRKEKRQGERVGPYDRHVSVHGTTIL